MSYLRHLLAGAALAGSITVVATPANAALTVYTTRAAFNTAAGATTTENFNSILTETSFATVPISFGAFSIVGFGANQFGRNFIDIPPHQFPQFNIDGTTNVNGVTATDVGFTITFAAPITAWGADFAAFQDTVLRSTITAGGVTVTPPIQAGDVLSFFGFTSDTPFTTIRFDGNGQSDGFSLDNTSWARVTVGAIPEPATWGMMMLGFGIVGSTLRRRSRSLSIA